MDFRTLSRSTEQSPPFILTDKTSFRDKEIIVLEIIQLSTKIINMSVNSDCKTVIETNEGFVPPVVYLSEEAGRIVMIKNHKPIVKTLEWFRRN